MKFIIPSILLTFVIVFSIQSESFAQKKKETIIIKTSAQCEMCEKRIEDAVLSVKGVSAADLNVKTSDLKVVFNNTKINADAIRQVVSKLGYDADSVKADHDAYHKLPTCCQKPGHHH